jgi:ABC-type uncharacterized transport system substrate-binding protein
VLRIGPFFSSTQRRTIIELAAELRLPVMWDRGGYVEQGGLVSYTPDIVDLKRRAAGYVARILAGANPADLPIEQAAKFELAINIKTANALGLPRLSSNPTFHRTPRPEPLTQTPPVRSSFG